MSFDKAVFKVFGVEGGSNANDKSDAGGDTTWGITEAVARAFGYTGPMNQLPKATALAIYKQNYWGKPKFQLIDDISESIAIELMDQEVLMPPGSGARSLQTLLNVFNNGGTLYADLTVDGALGPATAAALKAFLAKRGKQGETVLVNALNAFQGVYLVNRAIARPENEKYIWGWAVNRAEWGA